MPTVDLRVPLESQILLRCDKQQDERPNIRRDDGASIIVTRVPFFTFIYSYVIANSKIVAPVPATRTLFMYTPSQN